MKISPLTHGAGNPGQTLGSVDIGRTASPTKLARAKAIASGKIIEEEEPNLIEAQPRPTVKSIKMHTQRSTNRDELPESPVEAAPESAESSAFVSSEAVVEETKPLSPQFAALAKQKRALQLERAQLDKDKAALAAQPAQNGNQELVERLKSQPLSVLQEHGISYDQLTEAILSSTDGSSQKIRELEAKLTAIEQGFDKKLTDRDTQAEQAALGEMRREAERLAREGETFEMVRETNSVSKVIDLIHRTFKKTGEVLDVSEAMQLVEDHLLDENLKIAKLKKVQSRLAPEPLTQELQQQRPQMRTLTNRDSATTQLSRRQRALAAFGGTLKR